MKLSWFKGVDEDNHDAIREYYVQGVHMRKRMSDMLDTEIDATFQDMQSESHFESPNWPTIQADRLARVKALKYVKSLIQ